MTSPILASGMLRTAHALAGLSASRGRPALSDLRRSTSTAYYALFHQLTRHAALNAFPTSTEVEIANVTRWFTHTGIRTASSWVIVADGPQVPKKTDRSSVELLRADPNRPIARQLLTVAESFIELQDARHEADYSNDYDPVRYATLDHVSTAESATRAAWSMWRAQSSPKSNRLEVWDSYSRFLQLCLSASGGPKSR